MRKIVALLAAPAAILSTAVAAKPFNGVHVGLQGGWTRNDVTIDGPAPTAVPVSDRKDSVSGGVFAGYDHRLGKSVVAGAEVGVDISRDDMLQAVGAGWRAEVNPRHAVSATGRIGFLVTPTTLIYGRGGYQAMRAGTRFEQRGELVHEGNKTLDGWLVGAGLENALGRSASARLEYRFSELAGDRIEFKRHQVLAGIAYRF